MNDHKPEFEFDIPAAPELRDTHRPGFGWAIFCVVIGLMIVGQLVPYLERGSKQSTIVKEVRDGLKFTYLYAEAFRRMSNTTEAFKSFDRDIDKLAPIRKSDPDAALMWVVLRDVRGKKVTKEDVRPILKKGDLYRTAFAAIYLEEKLTEGQADTLIAQLPGGFPSRLASITAYRKAGVVKPAERVFKDQEVFTPVFLIGGVGLAGLTGVFVLIAFSVAKSIGKLPPVGFPLRPITDSQADRYAGKVGIILLVSFTLPGFLLSPVRNEWHPALLTAAGAVLLMVTALSLVKLSLFQRSVSFADIGWRRDQIGKDALWGLGAALANAPLLAIVSAISMVLFRGLPPAEHPVTSDLSRMSDPWMLVATFFAASVVAPIVEETLFRGMLAPALATVFKPQIAGWIVAGFCFAAIHPTGIPAWPALATLGVVASIANYQTGSLVSSVFMHGFHNAIILTTAVVMLG